MHQDVGPALISGVGSRCEITADAEAPETRKPAAFEAISSEGRVVIIVDGGGAENRTPVHDTPSGSISRLSQQLVLGRRIT